MLEKIIMLGKFLKIILLGRVFSPDNFRLLN